MLRQILNRHPEIVCGPETHLFCKSQLYNDWESSKNRIFKKSIFGLKSSGFHPFNGMDISELPSLDRSEYIKMLERSKNVFEFWIDISMRLLELREGQVYGEKTPCNSIHFKEALQSNQKLYCIHIYRNPYDTIASLVNRGKNPMQALALYLYNTSNGLRARDMDNYLSISYESLVQEPLVQMTKLLAHLGLDFSEQILKPSEVKNSAVTKLESWKYDETEKVQSGSVNRFRKLDDKRKAVIHTLIQKVRLHSSISDINSIREICHELNYEFFEDQSIVLDQARKDFDLHKASYRFGKKRFRGLKYPFSFE